MTTHAHKKKKGEAPPGWQGRIWLAGRDGTFIGYGRAMLLERIREYGSISKAARSMEMSYKHAWDLIRSMQAQAEAPVVETSRGGVGGGGARLTLSGEELLAYFWGMYHRFNHFLEEETKIWQAGQRQKE